MDMALILTVKTGIRDIRKIERDPAEMVPMRSLKMESLERMEKSVRFYLTDFQFYSYYGTVFNV